MSGRIYVASSWRNERYDHVVASLRAEDASWSVYDFRSPRPGDRGFHWSTVADDLGFGDWHNVRGYDMTRMLRHPIARHGFDSDMDALTRADIVVLVAPCGRSAHLEMGYAVGAGKRTAILLDNTTEPELMYAMVDIIAVDIADVITWIRRA